jgi:meiotically up-regulated gene 157 (Mug157) protein
MHLSHQYNSAYFSGLVKNRCTYHTNTTLLTFPTSYRIDAPNTPIQLRLLFWLRKESMHQTHQYNAVYFSGLVKNRCTYHTNTTLLTFPTWYRIDAPNTPIQLRLLFWLRKESMHQTHQYNAAYFSGLVKNRCT